ncbi:hypothetical protein Salmuc_02380 [Salipiger mucosus DSM 16094]|uniref:Uncharacterized protein n=1 Tax=Salipiger mucosus DSM 16094 TaxID=1123237 RepID=S9RVI5_9RHOB|nr:hypothetical protein Salmuc_02380 [Salipiger mucosus DSM 16094]
MSAAMSSSSAPAQEERRMSPVIPLHDLVRDAEQRVARVVVLDLARDVQPRRAGRDDGIA